jgi:hypothetical protein
VRPTCSGHAWLGVDKRLVIQYKKVNHKSINRLIIWYANHVRSSVSLKWMIIPRPLTKLIASALTLIGPAVSTICHAPPPGPGKAEVG